MRFYNLGMKPERIRALETMRARDDISTKLKLRDRAPNRPVATTGQVCEPTLAGTTPCMIAPRMLEQCGQYAAYGRCEIRYPRQFACDRNGWNGRKRCWSLAGNGEEGALFRAACRVCLGLRACLSGPAFAAREVGPKRCCEARPNRVRSGRSSLPHRDARYTKLRSAASL